MASSCHTCPTRWKFTHKFILLFSFWPLNYERDVSRIEILINFYTTVRLEHVSVRITFLDEVGHTHTLRTKSKFVHIGLLGCDAM
jgi:hypothetical protein